MSDLNIIVPGAVCVKNFFKFSHQVFACEGMAAERWICVTKWRLNAGYA